LGVAVAAAVALPRSLVMTMMRPCFLQICRRRRRYLPRNWTAACWVTCLWTRLWTQQQQAAADLEADGDGATAGLTGSGIKAEEIYRQMLASAKQKQRQKRSEEGHTPAGAAGAADLEAGAEDDIG